MYKETWREKLQKETEILGSTRYDGKVFIPFQVEACAEDRNPHFTSYFNVVICATVGQNSQISSVHSFLKVLTKLAARSLSLASVDSLI